MDRDELLAPENTPNTLNPRTGVRRVNNWPIYLTLGALATVAVMVAVVAIDRAQPKDEDSANAEPTEPSSRAEMTSRQLATEIVGEQTAGLVPPETAVPSSPGATDAPPTGPVPVARPSPSDLDAPPRPPQGGGDPLDPERERIRQAKWQLLDDAIMSKTAVSYERPRQGAATLATESNAAPATDAERLAEVSRRLAEINTAAPVGDYKSRIAQIRAELAAGGAGDGGLVRTSATVGNQKGFEQFATGSDTDRWKLDNHVEAPRTPYELRAGFVIPATMISGINSDLPGQIMAQVSQDVYDTATGKHKLIPQGARLVGTYSSDVAYGQKRILAAWQRIVFPDGKVLDVGAMPGADSAGYSGFTDKVNNHYLRIFGSAFLMSGITAGVTLSQDRGRNPTDNRVRASDALSESLGQQLGTVMAQMITKNMNIAPTNEIRPGYRFNVMVVRDLTFKSPYRAFDYE